MDNHRSGMVMYTVDHCQCRKNSYGERMCIEVDIFSGRTPLADILLLNRP